MKLVIYKRVSTQEQNKSSLELSAQDSDIEYKIKQLKSKYKNVEVLDIFVEIESGSTTTLRPKLIYAIAKCKKEGAYLLVQKNRPFIAQYSWWYYNNLKNLKRTFYLPI